MHLAILVLFALVIFVVWLACGSLEDAQKKSDHANKDWTQQRKNEEISRIRKEEAEQLKKDLERAKRQKQWAEQVRNEEIARIRKEEAEQQRRDLEIATQKRMAEEARIRKAQQLAHEEEQREAHRVAQIQAEKIRRQRELAEKQEQERVRTIKQSIPCRDSVIVVEEDYKRDNEKDRSFRTLYFLRLLQHFECKCAHCGAVDNGVDIDHYFIPKCKGGNFLLKHKCGATILNAVPLCKTCNRSKGASSDIKNNVVEKMIQFSKIHNI